MRVFVAINLPEHIKKQIANLQTQLKEQGLRLRWVKPNAIHLTLQFLGEVDANRIHHLCQSLEEETRGINSFTLTVAGVGCFPTPQRPRVFWVGITEPPENLFQLQKAVLRASNQSGIKGDRKKFSPHLTIARWGKGRPLPFSITEPLKEFKAGDMLVQNFALIESELSPQGAKYYDLAKFNLI